MSNTDFATAVNSLRRRARTCRPFRTFRCNCNRLREASDRARERRALVERQLADLQSPDPVVASVPPPAPATGQAGAPPTVQLTTAQQLEAARQQLGVLATQFTPAHPACAEPSSHKLRELEVKAQEEARQPSRQAAPVNVQSIPEVARQKRIRDLKLKWRTSIVSLPTSSNRKRNSAVSSQTIRQNWMPLPTRGVRSC